jgi:hypothetical protein
VQLVDNEFLQLQETVEDGTSPSAGLVTPLRRIGFASAVLVAVARNLPLNAGTRSAKVLPNGNLRGLLMQHSGQLNPFAIAEMFVS